MIGGLLMHGKCLARLLAEKQGRKLVLAEVDKRIYLNAYVAQVSEKNKWKALVQAIGWLLYSQKQMTDNGFGTFYLCRGWTSSYPETSGYIVPTLLQYAANNNAPESAEAARNALDWLLTIQKNEGGWQSGYMHQNRDAIVFNTGQVIRGMTAGYKHFSDARYLNAAIKAAEWIKSIQHPDGFFNRHVFLNQARVYDSYVVAPMLEVDKLTGKQHYTEVAVKHLDWIITAKQNKQGWFADCDNTVKRNQKPIIHTIAYTIDGMVDCGVALGLPKYIDAAIQPAARLRDIFLAKGRLNGRYDAHWNGSEAFITTGGAQLAIIWHKLFTITGNTQYKEAVLKMNSLLTALQQRTVHEEKETRGALFGSFPMWGRYETFGCPNWATKYLADSLMNEAGYER